MYNQLESKESLMVCAADHECLIDRYDGRSMLDHIPVKSSKSFSVKSKDLNLLNYERYRSIVEFYKEKINEDEAVKLSQNRMINTKMAPTQIEYDKKLFNERYKEEISKLKPQVTKDVKYFAPDISDDVIIVKDTDFEDVENNREVDVNIKPEPSEDNIENIDLYALSFGIKGYSAIVENENTKILDSYHDNKRDKYLHTIKLHNNPRYLDDDTISDEENDLKFSILTNDRDEDIIEETHTDQMNKESLDDIYMKSNKLKEFLRNKAKDKKEPTKMDILQLNIKKNLKHIIKDDLKKQRKAKGITTNEDSKNHPVDRFGRIKKVTVEEVRTSNDTERKSKKRNRSRSPKGIKKPKSNSNSDGGFHKSLKSLSKIDRMLKELEK